jgi:hypothetical protein
LPESRFGSLPPADAPPRNFDRFPLPAQPMQPPLGHRPKSRNVPQRGLFGCRIAPRSDAANQRAETRNIDAIFQMGICALDAVLQRTSPRGFPGRERAYGLPLISLVATCRLRHWVGWGCGGDIPLAMIIRGWYPVLVAKVCTPLLSVRTLPVGPFLPLPDFGRYGYAGRA